MGGHGWA
jgi:hypothetical protein